VVKLLWLAIINIEDKRAANAPRAGSRPGNARTSPPAWSRGQRVMGWREALNELDSAYPGRLR
jgi:putative transposase